MLKLRYTAATELDIEELSEYGLAVHGMDAVVRYNKLVQFTIEQLRETPDHARSKEVYKEIKMIHLRYFKKDAPYQGVTVQKPAHFVFYRIFEQETLEIIRILREERDFLQHLS